MRCFRLVVAMAGLITQLGVAAAPGSVRPDSPSGGPTGTVHRLTRAYEARSLAAYARLLTADYRFHSNPVEPNHLAEYVSGFTREQEIRSAANFFDGVPGVGIFARPHAADIRAAAIGVSDGPDPEHPDSVDHYRVVTVRRFDLTVRLSNGDSLMVQPYLHVFHVVRGDAASLVGGQSADSSRWYIRRWLEDVAGLTQALAATKQDCQEPAPAPVAPLHTEGGTSPPAPAVAATAGAPTELAIRPLGNPACPLLPISCDLPAADPAWVEVFDVMGRLMTRRNVVVTAPGTLRVESGAGASLLPGVYWVRLSQAMRRPATRMVVVTR